MNDYPLDPISEAVRGDLAKFSGRECLSSGIAIFEDAPRPSLRHRDLAFYASSSGTTSEYRQWRYARIAPFEFGMVALRYARFAMHVKLGLRKALAELTVCGARRLVFAVWPLAYLVVQGDRWL